MSPAVNFRHQYARRVEERGAYSRKIADLDRQFFFDDYQVFAFCAA